MNDDPVGNHLWQYLPRLSLAPSGRLDAIFYDRRADHNNTANDVSFSYSLDQGQTFAANVRLTSSPSSTSIGPQYPIPSGVDKVEIGSRLGLVSLSRSALAAWTDTRNSSIGSTDQEIFTTTVDLSEVVPAGSGSTASTLGAAIVCAVALAAIAAQAVARLRRRRTGAPSEEVTS